MTDPVSTKLLDRLQTMSMAVETGLLYSMENSRTKVKFFKSTAVAKRLPQLELLTVL